MGGADSWAEGNLGDTNEGGKSAMSRNFTRRSVLAGAGVGGVALAGGLAAGRAVASYRRDGLSTADRERLPHVPEHVRPTDRAALGRDGSLKIGSAPAPACRLVERHLAAGEGLEQLGLDLTATAAEFVCDPRQPNLLLRGITRVCYEIIEVAWQPGQGWPIYRQRAPHTDHAIGLRYAGVPRHQIVLLDDRAIYVGNTGSIGVIDGITGPLRIDVNGEAHGEHRGFYKILITGIA